MTTSVNSSVQGTALIFYPQHDWVNGGVLLKPEVITSRHLKPNECRKYFIENTNLDSIRDNGVGTLIAFSKRDTRSRQNKLWSLGVLIFLHPTETIIAPCNGIKSCLNPSSVDRYKISDCVIHFGSNYPNTDFSLIYLNALNNVNCCGDDGYIESDVDGPDVLFNASHLPSKILFSKYTNAKRKYKNIYRIADDFKNMPIMKNDKDKIDRLIVVQNEYLSEPGFAFPYPIGINNKHPTMMKFGFLNYKNAMSLISKGVLDTESYIQLLDDSSMYHKHLMVHNVSKSRLVIEEPTDHHPINHIHGYKSTILDCNRILHALWKECENVHINDWSSLQSMIKRTYGNFTYHRTKTKSLGLNVYMGKKNSEFVRPTPKMSVTASSLSEYYRKEWDPTYHPILYNMVRDLSDQAGEFQKRVDPVYHQFLVDSLEVKKKNQHKASTELKNNKTLKCCRKQIYMQKYTTRVKNAKRKKWLRDFAAISILTCGNSFLSGFTNMSHRDNDLITFNSCKAMHVTLKNLLKLYTKTKDYSFLSILHSLKSRFTKNKRFTTYTTCGYKVYSNIEKDKGTKHHHIFFIYNSLGLAIRLSCDKSYYHTFDASFGSHQTSVPVTETDTHICFGDKSLFILAWGNGKSDKRKWMEANGFEGEGRLHNRQITEFFNQLPNPQQTHMINMGWI